MKSKYSSISEILTYNKITCAQTLLGFQETMTLSLMFLMQSIVPLCWPWFRLMIDTTNTHINSGNSYKLQMANTAVDHRIIGSVEKGKLANVLPHFCIRTLHASRFSTLKILISGPLTTWFLCCPSIIRLHCVRLTILPGLYDQSLSVTRYKPQSPSCNENDNIYQPCEVSH